MDIETARYIISYFPRFLSDLESMARMHAMYSFKIANTENSEQKIIAWKKIGWLTDEPAALILLKDGYNAFLLNTATRILSESKHEIFFNYCPKCGQLAQTPYARQCRCGNDWHDMNVALFKLNSAFQVTGRQFYLVGVIKKGSPRVGNYIDLTMIGLNRKPRIECIEWGPPFGRAGHSWRSLDLGPMS